MDHKAYLQRCYDLARLTTDTGTNPKVGAVLVHEGIIIGQGYYQEFGGAHAEVRALASVDAQHRSLIVDSTLYVSLEPCCIHSKTPPCTDAVLKAGIRRVHVGVADPFPGISGRGISMLRRAGVDVTVHDDEQARQLIAPFVTYQLQKRPYVTIKYAESADHYIGHRDQSVWLTNALTGVYTHKLRSEIQAILVGTTTAIVDNPSLSTRHYPGSNPMRLVIDKDNSIPLSHEMMSDGEPTVVFNNTRREDTTEATIQVTTPDIDKLPSIMQYCHSKGYMHLVIEGGASLIKAAVKSDLWDKAIVITTCKVLGSGVKAPLISGKMIDSRYVGTDKISVIERVL